MNLLRVGAFSILLSSCTSLEVSAQQPEQTNLAIIDSTVIVPHGKYRWIVTIKPEVIEAALPSLEPINPVSSVQEKLSLKFQELRKRAISDVCFQKRSDFLVRGFYYKKLAENIFYLIGSGKLLDLEIYDVRDATQSEQEKYQFTITTETKKNTFLRERFVGLTYLEARKPLDELQRPMLTLDFNVIELDERIVDKPLIVANPQIINLIIKNGVIIDALSDLERWNGR